MYWLSLGLSILSIVIAIVSLILSYIVKDTLRKNGEKDVQFHKNILDAQAEYFIQIHRDDIDFLPLCIIAEYYDNEFEYKSKLGFEYKIGNAEFKKTLLSKLNISIPKYEGLNFYKDCIDFARDVLSKKYGSDFHYFLYEDGKYLNKNIDTLNNKLLDKELVFDLNNFIVNVLFNLTPENARYHIHGYDTVVVFSDDQPLIQKNPFKYICDKLRCTSEADVPNETLFIILNILLYQGFVHVNADCVASDEFVCDFVFKSAIEDCKTYSDLFFATLLQIYYYKFACENNK